MRVLQVLALYNASPEGAGVMTSGGTESILMACYSARQKAYTERGVTEPEMFDPTIMCLLIAADVRP